jgi:hypothetical protein
MAPGKGLAAPCNPAKECEAHAFLQPHIPIVAWIVNPLEHLY